MRVAKSYTIDPDVSEYVDETKGQRSASERVNKLLRLAMLRSNTLNWRLKLRTF